MFEGKVSVDASTLNPSEIETLIKYKEDLLEHQRKEFDKRKKEEELRKNGLKIRR